MNDADTSGGVDLTGDRLGEFFRRVESLNPFLDNRINGPSANDVDVDAIHQAAFVRLTRLAREACDGRRGVGAVLWGEAGIGKSHLLSRLGRWANDGGQAQFVYLHNLQAAPEHLPRSLLNAVLSILTRGRSRRFVGTPLFELVHASILDAVGHELGRYTWPQLEKAYGRLVEQIAGGDLPGATLIDRTVWDVLFRFYRSAYRTNQGKDDGTVAALAVRWLGGQALDPEEARKLGLTPPRSDEPVALVDNQQIKQVLVALTRLAASKRRPFLLVFDQVDNLDAEQAAALARFLEAVIDSSPNLLVVTAGVKDTLIRWREDHVIQSSAWDRLAQEEINLQRVSPAEAVRIIEARLRHFLEPFADVELVQKRRQEDALFPLGAAWREQFFRDRIEVRPRDAINGACAGWRRQQDSLTRHDPLDWLLRWPQDGEAGPGRPDEPTTEEIRAAIDRRIAEKLTACCEQLEREPHTLPADADHLAGLVFALLIQCRDSGHRYGVWEVERIPPPRQGARPTYDLSIRQRGTGGAADTRTGVLFVTAQSAVSVAGFLRRLLEDHRPLDRVVLVTDQRVGLPLGERGREYLDDLRLQGPQRFRTLELNYAELIELEALQRVLGLAKSSDLEIEPRPGSVRAVTEPEVIEAYHRHDRYLASPLLRALVDAATDDARANEVETLPR
jgi:hypothetical protein